jgi:O-antigen/teichoic acid export membrane protein
MGACIERITGRLAFYHTILNNIKANPIYATVASLVGDSLIYLVGAAFIGLGNFVLVPLYTRSLPPADFGIYSIVDVTILILIAITQLGLGVSYLKWFAEIKESDRGELLGSSLAACTLTSGFSGLVLALFISGPLGEKWLQVANIGFAWTVFPIIVLENLQSLMLSDLRARRMTVAYSCSTIIRLLAIVGASLWFISVKKMGITGVFLGRMTGDLISWAILAILCMRGTKLRVSTKRLMPLIKYGLPLVWSGLMSMLLDASGRYFLNQFSTLDQVGYYAVALKISGIFQILINQPFVIAWGGLQFQIARRQNAKVIYSKIVDYLFLFTISGALILSFFTPTLFKIFATTLYDPAKTIFPLVLLVRAIIIMEYPAALGIYLSGRTKLFLPIYTVSFIVTFLTNWLLIPKFGVWGAIEGWLAGWLVLIVSMAFFSQRLYPLVLNWRILALPLLLWAGALILKNFGLNFLFSSATLPMQIIMAVVVIIIVGFIFLKDIHSIGMNKSQEIA